MKLLLRVYRETVRQSESEIQACKVYVLRHELMSAILFITVLVFQYGLENAHDKF
jgi:hypothetical protein